MNFKDFEQELPGDILAKGKSYFGTGAVGELLKEGGHWFATVEGSSLYEVAIKGIRSIKEWDCNCPYDHGPICKHVVAVLYAVKDHNTRKGASKVSKKVNPIEEIFKLMIPVALSRRLVIMHSIF